MKVGDRVVYVYSGKGKGLEGTISRIDGDGYYGRVYINWDRGTGPNNYANPDLWERNNLLDKTVFSITDASPPNEWLDRYEVE